MKENSLKKIVCFAGLIGKLNLTQKVYFLHLCKLKFRNKLFGFDFVKTRITKVIFNSSRLEIIKRFINFRNTYLYMKQLFKPNLSKIFLTLIILFIISLLPIIPAKECGEGIGVCKSVMPLFSFSTGFYFGDFSPHIYLGFIGIIFVLLEISISYSLACLIISKIKN